MKKLPHENEQNQQQQQQQNQQQQLPTVENVINERILKEKDGKNTYNKKNFKDEIGEDGDGGFEADIDDSITTSTRSNGSVTPISSSNNSLSCEMMLNDIPNRTEAASIKTTRTKNKKQNYSSLIDELRAENEFLRSRLQIYEDSQKNDISVNFPKGSSAETIQSRKRNLGTSNGTKNSNHKLQNNNNNNATNNQRHSPKRIPPRSLKAKLSDEDIGIALLPTHYSLSNDDEDSQDNDLAWDDENCIRMVDTNSTSSSKHTTPNNKGDHQDEGAVDHPTLFSHPSQFRQRLSNRTTWLVGLLILQSVSGFILQYNESFLRQHITIVNFLTMLVGAGGNAGNQASVNAVRGLAIGSLSTHKSKITFIKGEFQMAFCLSVILGLVGFVRAVAFRTPLAETFAITSSLVSIVSISVGLGALLPLAMLRCGIDPAHSSTTIQVLMDILGVTITCAVSALILGST